MSDVKNVLGDIWGAAPEDLQSKSSGKFGLNTGYLTKLLFNDKAGKDGADAEAIDITVQILDREYYNRFFINKEVYNSKNALVGPSDEGFLDAFRDHYIQVGAVIKHALKAVGVTDAQISSVPKATPETLEDLVPCFIQDAKAMMALLPSDFNKKSIDIFLEYQWNISAGQDRTYLTLPKNMKGSSFLCPSVTPVGKWTEVRTEEGLHYVDGAGNKHPFVKDETFMTSNKAIQQGVGATTNNSSQASPEQTAQKSTWD